MFYMNVINFFESDRQEHWLHEIERCDWGAGAFLHELLSSGTFFDAVGEGSRVLLLTDGDDLVSFCTYAQKDDIQPTELKATEVEPAPFSGGGFAPVRRQSP